MTSSHHNTGLLTYGLYSDWCPPQGCVWGGGGPASKDPTGLNPPPEVTNSVIVSSFYYIVQLRLLCKYALLLEHADDYKHYSGILAPLPAAFNARLFDAANATYIEPGRSSNAQQLSVQTTISLAYQLGVIPDEHLDTVIDTLVADIAAHDYHLNVGIVGIKYLLPTLSQSGRGDVALMIAQARTPPSYIYMVEQGATTLWETWYSLRYSPGGRPDRPAPTPGVPSWNHIMFGTSYSPAGTARYSQC